MPSPLRLAIDAGATSARFALFADPSAPILTSSCRGLNYTVEGRAGLEELFGAVCCAVEEAVHGAACGAGEIEAVGLAAAGVGRADVRARALQDLEEIRRRLFPGTVLYLFHDGESALYRSLGTGTGAVVAAGTGSIAYGRDGEGREARAGGWGHIVGDEGSAYWIAVKALGYVLRSSDGREPASSLTPAILAGLGIDAPEKLVSWLHHPGRTKKEIAALAPAVSSSAEGGDAAALGICGAAGAELAMMAATVIRRLGFGTSPRVGLTGSVLLGSAPVRERMEGALRRSYPGVEVVVSSREPEIGAALLLADCMAHSAPHLGLRAP